MIAAISYGIVLLTGAWLIGVSFMMLATPRRALRALSAMGGSNAVHFGELGLRLLVGITFVLAAAIGFVVTRFRAHSIIVTLSTHYVVPGAASDLWRDGARGGDRRRFGQPVGHALCRALG